MTIITLRDSGSVASPGAVAKDAPLTNYELDNNFSNLNLTVGVLDNLTTSSNSNIVAAVNEVKTITGNIGVITNLTTSAKSNIVIAVNELVSSNTVTNTRISNLQNTVGTLGSLVTSNTSDIVSAVNSVVQGNLRQFASTTSADLAAVITNETGSGALVFGTSPVLTTPNIGTPSYAVLTNATGLPLHSGVTSILPLENGGTGGSSAEAARTGIGLSNADDVEFANVTASLFIGDGSLLSNIASGGSGAFNTSISGNYAYLATTSSGNAFTAPTTADTRYIVHSIHVTNIGAVSANITADVNGGAFTTQSLGVSIPMPAGTSLELLMKPKILHPNDSIILTSSDDTSLHATVTVETSTDVAYFGTGLDITSDDTYANVIVSTGDAVIESIMLVNDSVTDTAEVSVVYTDSSESIVGYYCYKMPLPVGSTVELLEQPKFLQSGYIIKAKTTVGNTAEVLVSGKYI